jgi:ribosomal protein L20
MKQLGIQLNRKMLADLAVNDPQTFAVIVEKSQAG